MRRESREPLAYILGEWGFRHLTLKTDARALVPRPETEIVVERVLALIEGIETPSVLDIGVGSGAIALAVKDERPDARVTGVDISTAALSLARENAEPPRSRRRLSRAGHGRCDGGLGSRRLEPAVCRDARRPATGARLRAGGGAARRRDSTDASHAWRGRGSSSSRSAMARRKRSPPSSRRPAIVDVVDHARPRGPRARRRGEALTGDDVLRQAIDALRAGEPVIVPTDTVYGLVAAAEGAAPTGRLYALKGRAPAQPSALLAADLEALLACAAGAARPRRGDRRVRSCRGRTRSSWRTPRSATLARRPAPGCDRRARAGPAACGRPRHAARSAPSSSTSANVPGGPDPRSVGGDSCRAARRCRRGRRRRHASGRAVHRARLHCCGAARVA